jgi:hypothetical protein
MNIKRLAASLLLSSALAACGSGGGKGDDGGAKPSVALSLSKNSVAVGATSQLTWSASNVSSCTASNAWNGARSISGNETVTASAVGSLTYTLSCTGDAGKASASAILTVTAASEKQSLTLTGFVTVAGTPGQAIADASVVVATGDDTKTVTTDASGAYSVTVEVDDPSIVVTAIATAAAPPKSAAVGAKALTVAASRSSAFPRVTTHDSPRPISLSKRHFAADSSTRTTTARKPMWVAAKTAPPKATSSAPIKLMSILGSFANLKAAAGDGTADASENIRNNITQLSTAEAALAIEANDGSVPGNSTQLNSALKAINSDKELQLAGTLKLIMQSASYSLPAGVSDTLAFAQSAAIRDPYIAQILSTDQGAQDLQTAIDQTLADPQAVAPPSAASVPTSLLLGAPVASNPVGYGNYGALADAFTFAADGTGSYASAIFNAPTHWTVDATHIHVALDTAQSTTSYELADDGNGTVTQVPVVYTVTAIDLIKTGDKAYAATFSGQRIANPDAQTPPTDTSYQSSLVILVPGDSLSGVASASLSGLKSVMPIYRINQVESGQDFQSDVLSFGNGGTGSMRYSAQSFSYANDAGGALKVTLADGAVLRYYHLADLDAAAGYVFVDYLKAGVHRVAIALAFAAPLDLQFTEAGMPATYYQFGYGDESPSNDTLDARTTGFALQFFANHTMSQPISTVEADGSVEPPFPSSSGSRDWLIDSASGSLVVRRTLDSSTNQSHCDLSVSTCLLLDEREIIPIQVSADRRWNYWIEHRRFGDGPNGEITSTTPDEYLARYYEVRGPNMINGSWELVSFKGQPPATPHADIISFFTDNTVLGAFNDNDPNCDHNGQGIQFGSFQWPAVADEQNLVSAHLTATLKLNQPGSECGLSSALAPGGVAVQINGLGQLIVDDGGDVTVLRRVPGQQGQLTGAWLAGFASEKPLVPSATPAVVSFFADGRYVLASIDSGDPDCPDSGVEYGEYSFDAAAQQLRFHDLTLDTSTCGLVDKGESASVFGAQLDHDHLVLTDGSDAFPFVKLSAP